MTSLTPDDHLHNTTYELIDFGSGEKLERFGRYLVRRTCLYAQSPKNQPSLWESADLSFDEQQRKWRSQPSFRDENWTIEFDPIRFQLKPTPVGHLGVFPEQELNWNWIRENLASPRSKPLKAINLFAYTGGTTMALANCGVEVVHLDGAANTVKWARSNASYSGLQEAPIRWIAEDVMKFVRREIKRGNHYDILVADPPSFGRGPKKEQWRIDRDLPELFELLGSLLPQPTAVIFSCHTEGYSQTWLADALYDSLGESGGTTETLTLTITSRDGRQLESGECVRWITH